MPISMEQLRSTKSTKRPWVVYQTEIYGLPKDEVYTPLGTLHGMQAHKELAPNDSVVPARPPYWWPLQRRTRVHI